MIGLKIINKIIEEDLVYAISEGVCVWHADSGKILEKILKAEGLIYNCNHCKDTGFNEDGTHEGEQCQLCVMIR